MYTLESTFYKGFQINSSLESSILQAYLDWGLVLTTWTDLIIRVCPTEFGSSPGLTQAILYKNAENKDLWKIQSSFKWKETSFFSKSQN